MVLGIDVTPSTIGRIEKGGLQSTWAKMNNILIAAGQMAAGASGVSGEIAARLFSRKNERTDLTYDPDLRCSADFCCKN